MTVLGNIVAVTSIIAVVSLIQGLNASVKDAILNQAGADSFGVQQFPVVRNDDDYDRTRNNPRITMNDVRAVKRFSPLVSAVMLDSRGSGQVVYRDRTIDNVSIQGVSSDFANFSTFSAERGRLMSATEVDRSRPAILVGWDIADRLFGSGDPIDRVIQVEGVHFTI